MIVDNEYFRELIRYYNPKAHLYNSITIKQKVMEVCVEFESIMVELFRNEHVSLDADSWTSGNIEIHVKF